VHISSWDSNGIGFYEPYYCKRNHFIKIKTSASLCWILLHVLMSQIMCYVAWRFCGYWMIYVAKIWYVLAGELRFVSRHWHLEECWLIITELLVWYEMRNSFLDFFFVHNYETVCSDWYTVYFGRSLLLIVGSVHRIFQILCRIRRVYHTVLKKS
jgi:hypothetical protein